MELLIQKNRAHIHFFLQPMQYASLRKIRSENPHCSLTFSCHAHISSAFSFIRAVNASIPSDKLHELIWFLSVYTSRINDEGNVSSLLRRAILLTHHCQIAMYQSNLEMRVWFCIKKKYFCEWLAVLLLLSSKNEVGNILYVIMLHHRERYKRVSHWSSLTFLFISKHPPFGFREHI